MLPELRIGYVAASDALLPALRVAKHLTDWHTPSLIQHAQAKFIDDGDLARHIRRGPAFTWQRSLAARSTLNC